MQQSYENDFVNLRIKSITHEEVKSPDFQNEEFNLRSKKNTIDKITKVLLVCIYNKSGNVWKAFLEMDTIENAVCAKENLDDYQIFQDGSRVNVFYSNLNQIRLQNDNSGGVDYSIYNDPLVEQLQKSESNDQELIELTTNLSCSLQKLDLIVGEKSNELNSFMNQKFLQENQESPVLYCRGLNSPQITIDHLMVLFLNFGNVNQIVKIPDKQAALIEFQNIQFATQAKDYLGNTFFFGCQLKIFYSNYQSIQQRRQKSESEEALFCDKMYFRYNPVNFIRNFNPPSSTLHISNLPKEFSNPSIMQEFFRDVADVKSVKYIQKDNRVMALTQFGSIDDSFRAMVTKQSQYVMGKRIQISFTRSKI